jgi:hypothetical protein
MHPHYNWIRTKYCIRDVHLVAYPAPYTRARAHTIETQSVRGIDRTLAIPARLGWRLKLDAFIYVLLGHGGAVGA